MNTGHIHSVYDAFLSKLRAHVILSEEDERALIGTLKDVREVPKGKHIVRKGDRPKHVHLLLHGWAARYEILAEGGRSITAFLLPGDLCDQHVTVLGRMDHSIVTLTPATVAYLPNGELDAVARKHPRLAQALWWTTLVDEAVLRAWLVNIGRREAFQAIGHLLCELHNRLTRVGLTDSTDFHLPLTQEEIADSQGLTPIHVNRMLRRLRNEGYISTSGGTLTITDVVKLEIETGFDASYLHSTPVDVALED